MSLRYLFRVSTATTKRLKCPNAQFGASVFQFSNEYSAVMSQRSYHVSTASFAKAKKGGKSDDDGPVVPLPDLKTADGQMENHIFALSTELLKLKVGRANVDTFNDIFVESYGTVAAAGQVTLKGPTKVSIAVYDPTAVKSVADAIKASGLGVNPTIEGNNVIVNIPKPSKEARDLMIKAASKLSDKSKQDIRQTRKEMMDALKKCKASNSADDIQRRTKEVDVMTEKKVDKVSALLKKKEEELNA